VKEVYRVLELAESIPGQPRLAWMSIGKLCPGNIIDDILPGDLLPPETIAAICFELADAEENFLASEEQGAFPQVREYLISLNKAFRESSQLDFVPTRLKMQDVSLRSPDGSTTIYSNRKTKYYFVTEP
jgi:hypothetical protein